jgi:hypothetical protein
MNFKMYNLVWVLLLGTLALISAHDAYNAMELESALAELSGAIQRGEISEADLDLDMDDDEEDEEAGSSVDVKTSVLDQQVNTASCVFSCGSVHPSFMPIPRTNYKPKANGCGAAGESWFSAIVRRYLSGVPLSFSRCCDAHDVEYGTCESTVAPFDLRTFKHGTLKPAGYYSKAATDARFAKCLTRAVKAISLKSPRSSIESRCIDYKLNKVFFEAVDKFGCDPYLTAQSEACVCVRDPKQNAQFNQG